jgi:4-hydroxybenzoate polyprenyltransferase
VTGNSVWGYSRSLLQSSHPIPSLVVASLTTSFAWAAGLGWWQVVVVFVAMVTNQFGIGLGNDWIDADRDMRSGRGDKPVAAGIIPAATVRNTAIVLGTVALGASALLGPWPLLCQAVMLGAGWWYNLHAKSHWSSPLSYLVGFGLLPVFPLLALTPPHLPAGWIIAVAGLLGIAAHFANALPDLDEDKNTGIRGLPQLLGPRLSGVLTIVTVSVAAALIGLLGEGLPIWVRVLAGALAIGTASVAGVLAFYPRPPRIIFPLVMVSAAICTLAIVLHIRLT